MSTQTNGFAFAFPEVQRAYKTSIRRKLSSKVLGTILSRSLPIAIGAGIGVYLLHIVSWILLDVMLEMKPCWGLLGAIVIDPFIVGLGGYVIGLFVGKAAIKAKFPDAKAVGKLALVIGLVGYLAYLTMYMLFFDASERFDHWIDYARQAIYLTLFILLALAASTSRVEETPFCENCNEFMVADDIGKYNTLGDGKGLDIAQEPTIIDILNSRRFANLNELSSNWVTGNYCVIRIWHCPICNNNGFVDCITVQSKMSVDSKGQTKKEAADRLVHSSHINGEEIQILLQIKKSFGIPK